MGFLLFAYRKLTLKRQINDLQLRLDGVCQQRSEAARRIGDFQQYISAQKNQASVWQSNAMMAYSNDISGKFAGLKDLKPEDKAIKTAELMEEMKIKQQSVVMGTQAYNSIFETQARAQEMPLKAYDTYLEQQQASIETQLKLLTPQLQAVEKAEDESAKQCAPKFGLG